jgi:uncharacterized DUF497 family protein
MRDGKPELTIVDGSRHMPPPAEPVTAGRLDGRVVAMVWTQRGDARHIISMRHCHAKEEEIWLRRMG